MLGLYSASLFLIVRVRPHKTQRTNREDIGNHLISIVYIFVLWSVTNVLFTDQGIDDVVLYRAEDVNDQRVISGWILVALLCLSVLVIGGIKFLKFIYFIYSKLRECCQITDDHEDFREDLLIQILNMAMNFQNH
jgi:hypothetical protein